MTTIATKNDVLIARLERRLGNRVPLADALYEAREWLIECYLAAFDLDQSVDLVDELTDAQVLAKIQREYAGGIAAFAAAL